MKFFFRCVFGIIIICDVMGILGILPIAPDFTWLGLLATMIFVWTMLEVLQLHISVWLLVLVAVILDGASALLGLYSLIPPWDRLVHFWGGVVAGACALELILGFLEKRYISVQNKNIFTVASVFLLVTFLGFLYEFLEYLVDHFQYGYPRSLVSAYNSIEDQLFNLLGTTIVLGVYYIWKTVKRKNNS